MKKLILATMFILSTFALIANSGIFQTYIILDIDGSGNSYYAGGANTDGATTYAGMTFTPNTSFILNGGEVKTFKNGGSDVTGAYLFYRVYKSGETTPAFSGISLPFAENLPNSGDQKWAQTNANIDIRQAIIDLNQGIGNYILEVYWKATSSDGDHYDSNGENNFSATINVTAPFPVVLSLFSAKKSNSAVDIQWTTQSEINNDHFEIEKSKDGINWGTLDKVDGKGNSATIINYEYTDMQPFNGNNYYRLRQVDFDGKSTLSAIQSVFFDEVTTKYLLYPNPASSSISFQSSQNTNAFTVRIWDVFGNIMIDQESFDIASILNINNWDSGMYYWRIEEISGQSFTGKFIKE